MKQTALLAVASAISALLALGVHPAKSAADIAAAGFDDPAIFDQRPVEGSPPRDPSGDQRLVDGSPPRDPSGFNPSYVTRMPEAKFQRLQQEAIKACRCSHRTWGTAVDCWTGFHERSKRYITLSQFTVSACGPEQYERVCFDSRHCILTANYVSACTDREYEILNVLYADLLRRKATEEEIQQALKAEWEKFDNGQVVQLPEGAAKGSCS